MDEDPDKATGCADDQSELGNAVAATPRAVGYREGARTKVSVGFDGDMFVVIQRLAFEAGVPFGEMVRTLVAIGLERCDDGYPSAAV